MTARQEQKKKIAGLRKRAEAQRMMAREARAAGAELAAGDYAMQARSTARALALAIEELDTLSCYALANPNREATPMICRECGRKFTRVLGRTTCEVRCPKCHGYDTDVR